MYKEYPPCRLLSGYIDKYWEFKGAPLKGTRVHILPDGCTDFIFTLGEAAEAADARVVMQPYRCFFVGPMTKYSGLETRTDTVHMLGIRFLPCGLFRFAPLPLHELADQRIPSDCLPTIFSDSLTDALGELPSLEARLHFIETYLIRHLYALPDEAEKRIRYAVDRIERNRGKLPILRLAAETNLCQRQLQRQFKEFTGFSPKEYSRIIQFRRAAELLRNADYDDLLSVAIETGYYDVSHLSREIKRMSGKTPLAFRADAPAEEPAPTYVMG